ncbi:MAG: DUF421 domain-containing protein [Janthinobacterium lividum]
MLATVTPFDWQRLLISDQAPVGFLLEIIFRCVVTFILTIAALRTSGKRRVRQLSLFEFGLVLVLGSAADDATFYHDVPLLYVVVIFVVIIGLYVLSNWIIDKHPRVERLLEGAPELIVVEGEIDLPTFKKANLTTQELFGQLRQYQVEHLGQVRRLYLEATGEVSVFLFEPQHERPGLPIWPELYKQPLLKLPAPGTYACHACATVRELPAGPTPACLRCRAARWLAAGLHRAAHCLAARTA